MPRTLMRARQVLLLKNTAACGDKSERMRGIENRKRNKGVSLQKNAICKLEQERIFFSPHYRSIDVSYQRDDKVHTERQKSHGEFIVRSSHTHPDIPFIFICSC